MLKQTLGAALTGLCLVVSVATADDTPLARGAAPAAPVATAVQAAQAAADIAVQLAANPIPSRVDDAADVILNADGSSLAVAGPDMLSMNVARLGPDGKLILGCVHSREEYDAFFLAEPQPSGLEVR